MNNEPMSFEIKVTGEITGEQWAGVFKAKKRLSYRDQLKRDQIRRELLGADAQNASALALSQAQIFSELAVRLVQTPSWWSEYGNGLDLEDDNVIVSVYENAMRIEREAFEELKKAGEAAKAEISQQK